MFLDCVIYLTRKGGIQSDDYRGRQMSKPFTYTKMVATFFLFRSRNTQQCQRCSKGYCITTVAVFLVLNTNKQF